MSKPKIQIEQLKVKYPQQSKKSSEPQIQTEQIKPVKYQQQIHDTDRSESQHHAESVNSIKYQPEVQIDTTDDLEQPQLPIMILGTSLLLGIVSVFLFQNHSWGFNLSLFIFLLVISQLFFRKFVLQPLSSSQYLLIATSLFFAITLIWRKSLILNGLSFFGLFLTIYLAYTLETRKQQSALDVSESFQDLFSLIKYVISSYYQLVTQDIEWSEIKGYWKSYGRAIIKGLIITIPFLFLLTFLLIEVDFHLFHTSSENFKLLEIGLQYGITFIISSWIAVALLRSNILSQQEVVNPPRATVPAWQIGRIEVVMILGAVNLLLLVAIMSSDAWVDWTTTLTPATNNLNSLVDLSKEPAKTISTQCSFLQWFNKDWVDSLSDEALSLQCSFFQWVTVAVLVIILLLLTQWLYKPATPVEEKTYQLLIFLMVFMTLLIQWTVMDRLYSYTEKYGWTEARFYAFIILRWWLVLFIWFIILFVKQKQEYFINGTIVITLIFIGLLHFINPDERLAEANLGRLQAGKSFEMNSVTSLSSDAFPALIAQLPVLSKQHRCQLLQHIQKYQTNVFPQSNDWRGWHWTQKKTQEYLQKVQPILLLLPEDQRCD